MTTRTLPSSRAAPAGPRPVRWTCAEFHRFGDMGAFEGRRAMLIDGVVLEEGPMNPPLAITLGLVEEAIRSAFGIGWWLRHQSPLILGQAIDPEPDLAIVPGGPRSYSGHPTTADLVVEVAYTPAGKPLDKDAVVKALARPASVACFIRMTRYDPKEPDPAYARIFRDGTVLLVFEAQDMRR